jgi:hypothetical protein
MNFEFVEFYPWPYERKTKSQKEIAGTIHVYLYNDDFQFDIKGIMVFYKKDKMYFNLPAFWGYDPDKQKNVKFSVVNFTQEEVVKDFKEFLAKEVEPIIRERLKAATESSVSNQ